MSILQQNIRKPLTSLWTYVALGLLVYYVSLYLFLDLPTNLTQIGTVNPLRTLLGGLATGLITAQALVFTISLVAAQLNARYTHRMIYRIFTWPTGLYMGLFICSSIYSLIVLASLSSQSSGFAINLPGGLPALHPVSIALALAGTCLVLLLPYLWSFKQRLDPERLAHREGQRAVAKLSNGLVDEIPEVAALDNIVMSAFGYRDYDTFGRGVSELGNVSLYAWRHSRNGVGQSIFRRITQIGIASIDDPRAPFQVADCLASIGKVLSNEGIPEAARQAAVAISEIGEVAIEKNHVPVGRHVSLVLSSLGVHAAEKSLVSVAEEAAYSLGHLGTLAAQQKMEDSTRQVAAYLRRVGARAAQNRLDLATRQSVVSLWALGGSVHQHLPHCSEVVARELELMERVSGAELIDSGYLSAPRSEVLDEFRHLYLREVRRVSDDVA